MEICEATLEDRGWMAERLVESWGSTRMALRGELIDLTTFPALIAGKREGLLSFRFLEPEVVEILALEAFARDQGVGTRLIDALAGRGRADGRKAILVITTNDNVDALRFYQRRGFVLANLRVGAVVEARRTLKPEIPLTGFHGIPIRDEIELRRDLV